MSMVERLQEDIEIVFVVGWEYEDQLPDYITDEFYKTMYPMSKVEGGVMGIRMFPYITIDGDRHFLGDFE